MTHNGMTDTEQPEITLHTYNVRVISSALLDAETVANAVWAALPLAEDGDVIVTVVNL